MKICSHDEHCCARCGKKLSPKEWFENQGQNIISFLCALCLVLAVGTAEMGFGKVAKQDNPLNSFPTTAVDHIFTSTTGTTAASGDIVIDFARIHQVQHPKKFILEQENDQPI